MTKTFCRLVSVVILAVLVMAGLAVNGCGDSEEATTTTAAGAASTSQSGETTLTSVQSTSETSAPAEGTVVLRLPMGQPDGDPLVVPVQAMAERFNARTNGTYQIQVFPAASLISPTEALDACRTGSVEMASICYPIYAGADERLSIIELPFVFNNVAALNAAHNDKMIALFDGLMNEKFSQKVLGINHIGFNETIGTKPVKTLDDWKGILVGVASPIAIDTMQLLGAQTVVIDWTESYSNLDKKVVDHVLANPNYMVIAELYKPGKYSTWMSALANHYGLHINLDVWNAMPAEIQQILQEEVNTAEEELNRVHVEICESNRQTLIENGCEVFVPDDQERAKWKAKCDAYVADKVAQFGDFGAQFMSIVQEANAANP